tara:strand:+ start:711 stop:980 length:270 start_codon:yes stop_codon:yes gene_type:complete
MDTQAHTKFMRKRLLGLPTQVNEGDEVYISPKSLGCIDSSANNFHPEKVVLLKKTPKRFKVSWDCDGQKEEPIIIYVKFIYKNPDDVEY